MTKIHGEHYYQCSVDCPQQTLNFSQPLHIPDECQPMTNASEIFRSALICLIDYRIDYDAEHIYLQFRATNDTSIFEGENFSEYLVQTLWLGLTFESNQPNITHRQYGCRTSDDCARKFYLKTIERLVRRAPKSLEKIHRKLFTQNSTLIKRRCIDSRRQGNRTAILCPHGLCSAHQTHHHFVDKVKSSREQQCRRDTTAIFFSETQFYLPQFIPYEREAIEYTCNKHLCNRHETIEAIRKLLNDYTHWNRPDDDELDDVRVPLQIKSSSDRLTTHFLVIFLLRSFF